MKTLIPKLRLLLLCFCGIVYLLWTERVMPWNREEAIATTLLWGGLAAIPPEAHDIEVRTQGGMFSRKFLVHFECSPAAINDWLRTSKPIKNIQAELKGHKRVYRIYPGEVGSLGGKVEINGEEVEIAMSWS